MRTAAEAEEQQAGAEDCPCHSLVFPCCCHWTHVLFSLSIQTYCLLMGACCTLLRQDSMLDRQMKAWREIVVPDSMGLDCGRYKWAQTLTHVEVTVRVPHNVPSHQVQTDCINAMRAGSPQSATAVRKRLFSQQL